MERTLFQMHAESAYLRQLMEIRNALMAQIEAYHHKYDDRDVTKMSSEAYTDFGAYRNEIERARDHGINMANVRIVTAIDELIEKNRISDLSKEEK